MSIAVRLWAAVPILSQRDPLSPNGSIESLPPSLDADPLSFDGRGPG